MKFWSLIIDMTIENKKLEYISRKCIYLTVISLIVLLMIVRSFFPQAETWIDDLIFNAYWPIILGMFELYFQDKDKKDALENIKKIDSTIGIVRGSTGNDSINRETSMALVEALGGEDLISSTQSILLQQEVDERVSKVGHIEKTKINLNP
jgi:hypothetical protein